MNTAPITENIFIALAENSPHPNFVFDLNTGGFKYVNPAFIALTNTDNTETLLTMVSEQDRDYLAQIYEDVLNGATQEDVEFVLKPADADERWLRMTVFPINMEPDEQLIIGHLIDLTAETKNTESLKKYAHKKNSVLNIIAHDLTGPLGMVNTLTGALNQKTEDPELRKFLGIIERINRQAVSLIRDLTEREFLETADIVLVKKRINLAKKLRELIEEYQQSEEISKRIFKYSAANEEFYVSIDEAKFVQIFNNLMTNALKFTHDEGTITIGLEDRHDTFLMTFADDGIGIPDKWQSNLFNKFTEARRKGLRGEPSIGLGMSIVKTIIEWHGGTIRFESKENQGTTFFVELPKT